MRRICWHQLGLTGEYFVAFREAGNFLADLHQDEEEREEGEEEEAVLQDLVALSEAFYNGTDRVRRQAGTNREQVNCVYTLEMF